MKELKVIGCESDSYRLLDSVTMIGHLHLELIFHGGKTWKGKGVVASF
jgi:hypothetical protein